MAFKPRAIGIDRGGNELTADEWNTDTSIKESTRRCYGRRTKAYKLAPPLLN